MKRLRAAPTVSVPAKIDNVPPAVTISTSALAASAMKTLPELSTATPCGSPSADDVAAPGVGAPVVPIPAKIDSVPPAVTFSTSKLVVSAM